MTPAPKAPALAATAKSNSASTTDAETSSTINADKEALTRLAEKARDALQAEGFVYIPGKDLLPSLSLMARTWIGLTREVVYNAPLDANPGAERKRRHRVYSIGSYNRRAREGERFASIAPCADRDEPYVTYLQPDGVNREHPEERRFAPWPKPLLTAPGLQELFDFVSACVPATLFPDEGKGLQKAGLHGIALKPEGRFPGISSPDRAHVDGEFITAVLLLERTGVINGGSLVVDRQYADVHPNDIPSGGRLLEMVLKEPGDLLICDDRRVAHFVAPVYAAGNREGVRSVVLLDLTPFSVVTSNDSLASE